MGSRSIDDITPHLDRQIGVRMDGELLAMVDNWRARQRPIPGRPEAIRRLLQAGLSAEAAAREGKRRK